MAVNVLQVNQAAVNLAEKALNKKAGRYFKVSSETMNGDDIDTVTVDILELTQEANGSNVPINNSYLINADKLIRIFDALPTSIQAMVDSRFGQGFKAYVQANMIELGTTVFKYRPE